MQVLARQLLFLANRNAGQAIPPLCWPVNCIKIGGRVALVSDPTVYCLYCDLAVIFDELKRTELTLLKTIVTVSSRKLRKKQFENVCFNYVSTRLGYLHIYFACFKR